MRENGIQPRAKTPLKLWVLGISLAGTSLPPHRLRGSAPFGRSRMTKYKEIMGILDFGYGKFTRYRELPTVRPF